MKIKNLISKFLCITLVLALFSGLSTKADTKPEKDGMYLQNLMHSGIKNTKGVEQLQGVKWKFKTSGKIYASPVIVDGIAYIGSEDKNLYAVNITTGNEVWKFATGGAVNSTPTIYNNTAFFASADGYFYAVDIKAGTLKWKFKTEGEKKRDIWDYYLSSPAVVNPYVYFGSGDGHMYALDINTGKLKWKYKTDGIVHSSPAVAYNMVYFGSFDGCFYALDCFTGTLKWKFKTLGYCNVPGQIQGSPSIYDGLVYFGCRDFNLYILDAQKGTTYWNVKTPSWIIATPTMKDGMVYFGNSDLTKFYSVDMNGDGMVSWSIPVNLNIFGGTTIVGDTGYFGSFNGKLYAVDLKEKKIKWTYQTDASKENYSKVFDETDQVKADLAEKMNYNYKDIYDLYQSLGSILSTPAVSDGVVYFGSTDGYLYALQ